jgi:hypothetical protein
MRCAIGRYYAIWTRRFDTPRAVRGQVSGQCDRREFAIWPTPTQTDPLALAKAAFAALRTLAHTIQLLITSWDLLHLISMGILPNGNLAVTLMSLVFADDATMEARTKLQKTDQQLRTCVMSNAE